MNGKRLLWIAGMSTLLTSAAHAWAANDFHVGASIGGASISDDRFFINDSSRAYKLYGGYQFNEYFVAEAAFIDFDDVAEVIVINTASQRAVADGHGISVVGMGQFPMGRFTLIAKAGALIWESDSGAAGEDINRDDGSDLLKGIGLRFDLTDRVSLALDYELYELDLPCSTMGAMSASASTQTYRPPCSESAALGPISVKSRTHVYVEHCL